MKLKVDVWEADGEDGGPDVVLAAHPHAPRQEVVASSLNSSNIVIEKVEIVSVDLTADFGVKTNAKLTPIS